MEKNKRKIEGDLRCTQETLGELERSKGEISQVSSCLFNTFIETRTQSETNAFFMK